MAIEITVPGEKENTMQSFKEAYLENHNVDLWIHQIIKLWVQEQFIFTWKILRTPSADISRLGMYRPKEYKLAVPAGNAHFYIILQYRMDTSPSASTCGLYAAFLINSRWRSQKPSLSHK